MENNLILVDRTEHVITITFNRPDRMNSFGMEMEKPLINALNEIRYDETIRVVILTGAGQHFCSGADMHLLHEGLAAPERLKMMKRLSQIILMIRQLPQAVIAKVQGVAYGVGANLALASDFVVAAENARFCEVFAHIGVMLDGGGTYFLPRLVGMAKAKELALLGEEIDGTAAAAAGLIYQSAPVEDLDKAVHRLVQKLIAKSPAAIALIKEGLEASLNMTLAQTLEWEASHQSILLQTPEHQQAVKTFLKTRGKL